jgi:hypothetical protein
MDETRPDGLGAEPSVVDPAERSIARGGSTTQSSAEKRRDVRYGISASAIVIETQTRTKLLGRATDLSASGCYLDTLSPFSVGTAVQLHLSCENHLFRAGARVTYSLPGMGMGLAFTNIPLDQVASLSDWIGELSGELTPKPSVASEPDFDFQTPVAPEKPSTSQDVLYELVILLFRKGLLTESEKDAFRKKLRL